MDVEGIEARGTAPLKPYLDRIAAAKDQAALQVLFASPDYASPVNLGIIPSLSNPTQYTAVVGQGGLGMPRDNYLLPGEKYEGYRAAYRAYVERIQTLAGIGDASAKADAIVTLETAMAKDQWSPEESRNIAKLNDPQTIDGLKAKAPEFDWVLMVKTAGLSASPTVLMTQNTALIAMGKIFAATPVDTWQAYLAYHFISDHAQYLPKAFDEAKFDFFAKTLAGVQAQRERWKRGVDWSNGALGEAVGEVYVAKYFPPAAKGRWPSSSRTCVGAYGSASTTRPGWTRRPRRPRSRSSRRSSRGSAIRSNGATTRRSRSSADDLSAMHGAPREFQYQRQLQRLRKPVDRDEWAMTPQTVNAYYSPCSNEIMFPAAILQPPFFDANADPAVNYGAIGAVIGHEMGHGFDDQGSQFDATGKFANWWTDGAKKRVQGPHRGADGAVRRVLPVPGHARQGRADAGREHRRPRRHRRSRTLRTNAIARRQGRAVHRRPDRRPALLPRLGAGVAVQGPRRRPASSSSSPIRTVRRNTATNGVVRNVDAWYAAFDVKPGDALYLPPDQRVHIW